MPWYVDVRGNNITGTIPESIGNCTSFEILDISYNQITGEIPYNIGFLQVATLSLQGNRLTGKIPEVIGLMQALAVLDLRENDLGIPAELGKLEELFELLLWRRLIMDLLSIHQPCLWRLEITSEPEAKAAAYSWWVQEKGWKNKKGP